MAERPSHGRSSPTLSAGGIVRLAREELEGLSWSAMVGRALIALLPRGTAGRVRARLLGLAGLRVGQRTLVMSSFVLIGGRGAWHRLSIGSDCFINEGCVFDATAQILIGNHVALGQGVLLTTSSHAIGAPDRRSGLLTAEPVTVGDGAWLASRVVVLPGVEIGAGAIVAAGAVVARSVPPHTLVGGVPAKEIRRLDDGSPG